MQISQPVQSRGGDYMSTDSPGAGRPGLRLAELEPLTQTARPQDLPGKLQAGKFELMQGQG